VSSGQHRFFGPFRLDSANAQLWQEGQKISLRRKTFDLLLYLVDHPGQLVTKQALLDAIWPKVTVSDSMPAVCVKELRKALGDEAKTPRFIETVHGRGYRFVAQVTSGAPAGATRKPPAAAKASRPIIVGRENELARLQSWYAEAALEGERRVIFVSGEAGIGKTSLIETFLYSIAQERAMQIGRGQCVEHYGAGEPYMPVLEALSRLGRDPGGERMIEVLNRFAPTWLAQMPELLPPEERARMQGQNHGVTQQRMLREMLMALEVLAAESPLVLVLEDLHWSDFSTLELISAIARRSEPARLLVIGTYRPMEVLAKDHPLRAMKQELELHDYCEELQLKLLDEEDIADYLERRFPSDGARTFEGLAPVIYERTDGNPLFMVNVIDYLVGTGLLADSHKPSAAVRAEFILPNLIEVPRNIRQMIERNFERLDPEEQATLEGASVAGAEFSAAAVAAALERPQAEVEACCARLARHDQFVTEQRPTVWPDGTVTSGFRFHHSLYQKVLYRMLPLGHRVRLHRLIAAREETGYGEGANEIAAELAHHYAQTNDKDKAVHYFRLAGERAVARGAVVEAEIHYSRALELLSELPHDIQRDRQELALQMALGGVLWTSKSWSHPETERVFSRAEELAKRLGKNTQLVEVLLGLLLSATGSGRYRLARELAQRMLMTAEDSRDFASLSVAHTFLGETLLEGAHYLGAKEHLELGSQYCAESDLGGLSGWGLIAPALLATAVLALGYPDRAQEIAKNAWEHAEQCGDLHKVGGVRLWLGLFYWMMDDALGLLEQSEAMRRMAVTEPVWNGLADFFAGKARMVQGDRQEGAHYLRKAIIFHESVGLLGLLHWLKIDEAKALASQGLIEDALVIISNAIADHELLHLRSPALLLRADLLAQSNAKDSLVEEAYRDAVQCARDQDAKYYELRAATHYAGWLKFQGRGPEAWTILSEIYTWFTEGFDTHALKEAKALLDALSTEPIVPPRPNRSWS
jgi:DNA-binding winged helix-turn-helix (wHTH) protein/tetratricopeptide (TPR) repeat protein